MNPIIEKITERLDLALRNAQSVEKADRESGSPVQSTAYDAGRVAGLTEALEIIRATATREG